MGLTNLNILVVDDEHVIREGCKQILENEGHDVIKFENKVKCYNEIVDFFSKHLKP